MPDSPAPWFPAALALDHERVDDLPVLVGLAEQLQLAPIIDRHVRQHGHHQGWSTGQLVIGWLAFILSTGNHCKSAVHAWALAHRHTLAGLLGTVPRPTEFSDDRLALVLRRLSNPSVWERIEADLWGATVQVYAVEPAAVRLDSTTTLGHHQVQTEGLMQRGHSKDHRPDLPQLKLMAAAAQPAGPVLASTVHPGHRADDPLYTPLIERVRTLLRSERPVLYVGDSKMAALGTRAELVAHRDWYLMPLPQKQEPTTQWEAWIDHGLQVLGAEVTPGPILATEVARSRSATVADETVTWTERVLIVRSAAMAERQQAQWEARLTRTHAALEQLSPPPKRGRKQYRDYASLEAAVTAVLARAELAPYLEVTLEPVQDPSPRWRVAQVRRREAACRTHRARLGWRVLVTNAPAEAWSAERLLGCYRDGWHLERCFHVVKDAPLGLSPLFVWREDQLQGLTHLLLLGLRLLTLLELQLHAQWATRSDVPSGLYPEQPRRTTRTPSAQRVLRTIARAEVTLTAVQLGDRRQWHLTPLPPLVLRLLHDLGLGPHLYERLLPPQELPPPFTRN